MSFPKLTYRLKYASNTLGMATCLLCGAVVERMSVHDEFHEKLDKLMERIEHNAEDELCA